MLDAGPVFLLCGQYGRRLYLFFFFFSAFSFVLKMPPAGACQYLLA
jgi:hypothetical protein